MKKLFTLVALLTCFLGAKAAVEKIYSVDYSTYTGFPNYVMGYVPEWIDGVMTDFGADYRYATQAELEGEGDAKWKDGEESVGTTKKNDGTEYQKVTGAGPYWHQYFVADGVPTEIGGSYIVKAMIKASEEINLELQMGWGQWWTGTVVTATAKVGTEWQEVEWEFTEIGGSSCNIDAKPGTSTATIEWKKLEVYTDKGDVAQTWLQMLTDDGEALDEEGHTNKYVGDAEFGAWPAWALEKTDGINANWRTDRAKEICAWALTMGDNFDDGFDTFEGEKGDRARPYPATIAVDPDDPTNHVFMADVHTISCIDDCDAESPASIAWSNQFWIMSPQTWKTGTKVRIKFKYKAEHACNVGTQIHTQWPSKYLHYEAVNDVAFTTGWQDFDKTIEFNEKQGGGASLAFNLCSDAENGRTANKFYFDDLSWEVLKLDHGYFVAGKGDNVAYDYAQATQFTVDPDDDEVFVATIGTVGVKDSWVNEVQISTVRGDKSAFLGATLKPTKAITLDEEGLSEWLSYTEISQAKIKLPAAGVYKITIAPDDSEMQFEQLEGDVPQALVDIVTNQEELVVNAVERDYLGEGEAEAGTGATWDNQFFIYPNRVLEPGEETVLEFDFLATTEAVAKVAYQGIVVEDDTEKQNDYVTGAFNLEGDNIFNSTEKHFKGELTMPNKKWNGSTCNGVQFLSFDLACIKEANAYTIKNVKWYLKNETEGKTTLNLINATGTDNFKVKIGAGNPIVDYGTDGISTVTSKKNVGSAVIYNLAGQRVSNSFKGIVVKDGKKVVIK